MKYVWIITATRETSDEDRYETTCWECFAEEYFKQEDHIRAYIEKNLEPFYPQYTFYYFLQEVQS